MNPAPKTATRTIALSPISISAISSWLSAYSRSCRLAVLPSPASPLFRDELPNIAKRLRHGAIDLGQRGPRLALELDLDRAGTIEPGGVEHLEEGRKIDLARADLREVPDADTADLVLDVHVRDLVDRAGEIHFRAGVAVVDDIARVVIDADVRAANVRDQRLGDLAGGQQTAVGLQTDVDAVPRRFVGERADTLQKRRPLILETAARGVGVAAR